MKCRKRALVLKQCDTSETLRFIVHFVFVERAYFLTIDASHVSYLMRNIYALILHNIDM